MKETQMIRNVGVFGHGKCGKTSLAEALLFTAGKTTRLGRVDDGTSCMDFEPEEVNRRITINTAFNHLTWKKHDLFLADTPGDDNFVNDAMFAARVVDSAIFVLEANSSVKFQTTRVAGFLEQNKVPTLFFVTKMDRERADFANAVSEIKQSLPLKAAAIHLPIGAEAGFTGVVDLLRREAYLFEPGATGKTKKADIPAELSAEVDAARESLMELVAETDDTLLEKFLEEGALTDEELLSGLRKAAQAAKICPVLAGSGTANLGTELLLNSITDLLPSPLQTQPRTGTDPKSGDLVERLPATDQPFSAQVFKTMADPYAGRLTIFRVFSGVLDSDTFYNSSKEKNEKFGQILLLEGKQTKPTDQLGPGMFAAIAKLKETSTGDTLCAANAAIVFDKLEPVRASMSYAVSTAKKDDEDKLFSSIAKMLEEDPTLRLARDPQTNEIILSGVGQVHITVIGEIIKRKFGVEMTLHAPKVPYKETIRKKVQVHYRHKKQSGGRGQFADNHLELAPLPRGGGFEFEDRIVGGVIPRQYIPAIEKGVVEAMSGGILAGYPVVDVKVAVFDGSFHDVDSSEMAFKISGSMGFKKGVLEANPVLLEPIMNMKIMIPQDCVGDVIGDINSRRGKVMGMDSAAKHEVVTAQVPMKEILAYAPDLTSITGGRGAFTSAFSHYEEVPAHLAEAIIASYRKEKGEE